MTLLSIDTLLRAYASGIFPMADSADAGEVFWIEPKRRGILPLEQFHVSRSLAKSLRSGAFITTVDQAFGAVVDACAARDETWINPQIRAAMCQLHEQGQAHSIEVWERDALVGGLYGVRLGRAFFGESMFSIATNASKVALAQLVARLRLGGFTLLDCQFITPHLASLGAIEISRRAYCGLLSSAVSADVAGSGAAKGGGDFLAFDRWCAGVSATVAPGFLMPAKGSPWFIWQALTQTS